MNREIRFRAWDNINKKYIPHEYLECCIKNINKNNSGKKQFDYEQYTGLNDKSGVYIFEGDIVRTPLNTIEEVKYSNDHALFYTGYYDEDFPNVLGDWNRVEVVGNIHQNGDLLND